MCTIDVVGLCPNIPHSEGLNSLRSILELRDNKQISSDIRIELAEIVLRTTFLNSIKKLLNRYVELNWKKFAPPYAILFMTDLEEKIPNAF